MTGSGPSLFDPVDHFMLLTLAFVLLHWTPLPHNIQYMKCRHRTNSPDQDSLHQGSDPLSEQRQPSGPGSDPCLGLHCPDLLHGSVLNSLSTPCRLDQDHVFTHRGMWKMSFIHRHCLPLKWAELIGHTYRNQHRPFTVVTHLILFIRTHWCCTVWPTYVCLKVRLSSGSL